MLVVLLALAISVQQTPQRAETPIEKQHVSKERPEDGAQSPQSPTLQPEATVNHPVADGGGPVNPSKQEPTHGQQEKGWVHQLRTDPVATFSALLFVATLLLWWATRKLVKGAEATAQRQLRAYVFVESAQIRDLYSAKGAGVRVTIKNFGQTPAYKYTASLDSDVVTPPSPPQPHLGPMKGQGSIAPGGSIGLNSTLAAFKPADMAVLVQGVKLLYVFGEIRYTDAFKEVRCTKFRYVFGGNYGSGAGDLALAEDGNDADWEESPNSM